MNLKEIAKWAKIKGLQLVGTGDFTHPMWLKEIKQTLEPDGETDLYKLTDNTEPSIRYMLTTEVCTIFSCQGKCRKVHHVIFSPSVECVKQINEALSKRGNLSADGRPIFGMTAPELVELVMQVSDQNMIFPAHAWTPWFSVFGAFSGFDTIEECYQDTAKHIYALETGLSSDPPMNWRLSRLDRYTLLSNSDSHSFWPWRMGREANVFELENLTYREITDAIKKKDVNRLKSTIETDPAYGKYHWSGHRNCNVSLSAQEAKKKGNLCPVCRKILTEGVEQRVEELADREPDFKPPCCPGFVRLMPLSEIIAAVIDAASPSTQAVWKVYSPLVERFGDEYKVLIDAPKEALKATVADPRIADAIIRVRQGTATVVPGYDGVYGKLVLPTETEVIEPEAPRLEPPKGRVQQANLSDFW